jgi:hypothetical protein
MKRGKTLDFYFNEKLSDYPWRKADVQWIKSEIKKQFPDEYQRYKVGQLFCKRVSINDLVVPNLNSDGKPSEDKMRVSDPREKNDPLMVRDMNGKNFQKGLSGRYIVLWQSHGRYYEAKTQRWEWQRAPIFRTVEDMYTQSYVLPFLIPMLENAGAYVMTPRERDTQVHEVIVDNNSSFTDTRTGLIRRTGKYEEQGKWEDAGTGFADKKIIYTGNDNPFTMGTARKATIAPAGKKGRKLKAEARWIPDIPERGKYAVYISYKSLPNSTKSAHYTVNHLGGSSEFLVNQTMGGGTWIYLGTFEFEKGSKSCITLDNINHQGKRYKKRGTVVTADAVKIGGGMGKIARGTACEPVSDYTVSGLPSFAEGAIYWMQWAGADSTVYHNWDNDYTNDYASRGLWVRMMSGGSRVNPKEEGKGIPFDLSMAFHSDAGTTPNDSIIGTLSIYTLMADGSRTLPDGEDRMNGRELADLVQSQIVNDVRKEYEPQWNRRFLWNKSYSESRTTGVPAMLLELLSHQNFADMKYGLDPNFRFTVSRAVYKGMLKYLSNRYGCPYEVEPLPVTSFSVSFATEKNQEGKAVLSWTPAVDSLEKTATPKGYILYTRTDDGAFDNGKVVRNYTKNNGRITTEEPMDTGHIYSYKIVAFNDGGKSFPSEILSIGMPGEKKSENAVMVVNDFYRISGPTWFDTPDYAGFMDDLDSGMPYCQEINYIGPMYQFRRNLPWQDDDNPGFGASYTDMAGKPVPGNTFDFAYIHGKAIMESGYPFYSVSRDAFDNYQEIWKNSFAADIICGKQVTTKIGRGAVPDRYRVFPQDFQSAIKDYTAEGKDILISGAHIGTDVWDQVFPVNVDSTYKANTEDFVKNVLGYKWVTNYATRTGEVKAMRNPVMNLEGIDSPISYYKLPNGKIYNAETTDGIRPASDKTGTILRYTDTEISAATCFAGNGYEVISVGFPLELVKNESDLRLIISNSLDFFIQAK